MKKINILLSMVFLTLLATTINAQGVKNYLGIKKTITFENKTYHLVWSVHPNENYYKQEYLPKGEKLERFNSMITIDYLKGNFRIEDLVAQKIQELKIAKKSDPITNYNVFKKDKEIILDFLMAAWSKNRKKVLVLERNIYRYVNTKKGVTLFFISKRFYGNKMLPYMKNLKKTKNQLIESFGKVQIPKINL